MAENKNNEIIEASLSNQFKHNFLEYALSVIIDRSLPSVSDGLKPVQRRIIYAMYKNNMHHESPFKKCARIIGEVIGKYHPHGDSSVYEALVRMGQDFSYRIPLIEPQGNFGSIDGDPPAAMRYTEARLSKIASLLIQDLEKEIIPFVNNYDETEQEPAYLPALFPNILVNGAIGIAVGMATHIPPHNLKELIDAIIALIKDSEIAIEKLLNYIKGPDFPTGCSITNDDDLKQAYLTGSGSVVIRAKTNIEVENKKSFIIISEIPYLVNKSKVLEKIYELVKSGDIKGIVDLRDESSRKGIRVVVEVDKNHNPQIVLNNLLKKTALQSKFSIKMLAIDNNIPILFNIKQLLLLFIKYRRDYLIKKNTYLIKKAEARIHILEGMDIALNNIDQIIKLLKTTQNSKEAIIKMKKAFALTKKQGEAILKIRLNKILVLEQEKLKTEKKELLEKVAHYNKILHNFNFQNETLINNLIEIKNKYGEDRKSQFIKDDINIADIELVLNEKLFVIVDKENYLKPILEKNIPEYNFHAQGPNISKGKIVDGTFANAKDQLILLTNQDKLYSSQSYKIGIFDKKELGIPAVNIIKISSNLEKIKQIITLEKNYDYILFLTSNGYLRKHKLSDFILSNNRVGINVASNNSKIHISQILLAKKNQKIIFLRRSGRAVKRNLDDIRIIKQKHAVGIKACNDYKKDPISSMIVGKEEDYLVLINNQGQGKKIKISRIKEFTHSVKGFIVMKIKNKDNYLTSATNINNGNDTKIMIFTNKGKGKMINSKKIPEPTSRNTQGVILIKLQPNEKVTKILSNKND